VNRTHSNLIIVCGIPGQMKLKYLKTSWKQVATNNFIWPGIGAILPARDHTLFPARKKVFLVPDNKSLIGQVCCMTMVGYWTRSKKKIQDHNHKKWKRWTSFFFKISFVFFLESYLDVTGCIRAPGSKQPSSSFASLMPTLPLSELLQGRLDRSLEI
jgi:hypothetical protein